MTHEWVGGKTWAGEQGGLLGTSRVIAELGTTSNPRYPWARTGWGLLSTPGPLAATRHREKRWGPSTVMGLAGGRLQG